MRSLPLSLLFVFPLCFSAQVRADLVFQSADLNPGDQYRLVFTTSTTRNAISTDIADYNHHVNSAANATGSLIKDWGLTWSAIASTETVNARLNTNTFTTTPNIPIYLVDGTKIADDYGDFWDLALNAPMNRTELDTLPPGGLARVWTGTSGVGTSNGVIALGTTPDAFYGEWDGTQNDAFGNGTRSLSQEYPLYGMSGVVTAVPEPGAFLCLGLVGIGFVARRKVLNSRKN